LKNDKYGEDGVYSSIIYNHRGVEKLTEMQVSHNLNDRDQQKINQILDQYFTVNDELFR